MKKPKPLICKTIRVFFLSFVIISIIFAWILYQHIKGEKNQYYYISSTHANMISNTVNTALSKVYTLNTLLVAFDGNTDFFDDTANLIYDEVRKYTGISLKNLAIAPNGVIEEVYPVKGNEYLLGFNLMDSNKPGNNEAYEAYIHRDIIVTNPFNLVQNSKPAIAARLPIFLKSNNNQYKFWGLVTVTLDFEDLLKAINLSSLKQMNIDYCLWYSDRDGNKIVLDGDDKIGENVASCEFDIKNLKWHLDLKPNNGWIAWELLLVVLLIVLAFSSLSALIFMCHVHVREMNDKLKYLANRDPLTSCYSRNYLNTVLIDSTDGKWRIPHLMYSLIIVDIDYFKDINDKYGHDVGDEAIKYVSDVLFKNIKPEDGDCVIRFGGDEFIVLYNDVTLNRLTEKIKTIIRQCKAIRIPACPDARISISIGAQPYDRYSPLNYYDQVKEADKKLYQSKKNGKDRYTI